MEIREQLEKERLFFDGGMGTMLQSAGLMPGELPELWNLSHADVIQGVHEAYIGQGPKSSRPIHLAAMASNLERPMVRQRFRLLLRQR